MNYRVAIYKRAARRLKFEKFAFAGYRIAPDGRLYRGNKECNTNDKRGRKYYEIHHRLGKPDRLGCAIYERDIIFDARFNALCAVKWNGCAFVLAHRQHGFAITFRYCDFRSESVEVVGNECENVLQQITAKGFTK